MPRASRTGSRPMRVHATRFSATTAAVALVSGLLLANQAAGHVVRGTDTWVHVAQPGVEISFTVSDEETAHALGFGADVSVWTDAWRVEADGKTCPIDADTAALSRKGGHMRFALRFDCGAIRESLELTPVFLSKPRPRVAHMARVLIGDRLAPFDLTSKAEPIVLKVGELLQSWNIALSQDYLGSRD